MPELTTIRLGFARRLAAVRPARRGRPWPLARRSSLRGGAGRTAERRLGRLPRALRRYPLLARLHTVVRLEHTVKRERLLSTRTCETVRRAGTLRVLAVPVPVPRPPAPAPPRTGAPPRPTALALAPARPLPPPVAPAARVMRLLVRERSERLRVDRHLRIERTVPAAAAAAAPQRFSLPTPTVRAEPSPTTIADRRPVPERAMSAAGTGTDPAVPAQPGCGAQPPGPALDDLVDQVLRRIERRAIAQRERFAGV